MQFVMSAIGFVLHFDSYLRVFTAEYGAWVYLFLFVLVFCETGLVVTPFLPGDSVLFMIGTLAASGILGLWQAGSLLFLAAVLGDTVNYEIGKAVGERAFRKEDARFFNRANLEKAHEFYRKWGGAAIFLGRFMPIIRTFVPFVAGIGRMGYAHFIAYNLVGGLVWVTLFLGAGYLFGDIPVVKENLTLFALGVIAVSLVPVVVGMWKSRTARGGAS